MIRVVVRIRENDGCKAVSCSSPLTAVYRATPEPETKGALNSMDPVSMSNLDYLFIMISFCVFPSKRYCPKELFILMMKGFVGTPQIPHTLLRTQQMSGAPILPSSHRGHTP